MSEKTPMEATAAHLRATCRFCGEVIEISGHMHAMPGNQIGFVSDDAGTKAAWDHQAKHDDEADAMIARLTGGGA